MRRGFAGRSPCNRAGRHYCQILNRTCLSIVSLLHLNLYLLRFHKVVTEISEDAASNGIKYFEISIDPYKFISKVIFLPPRPDKKADNVYSFSRTEASRECWMLYEVLQGLSIGGIIDAN